MFKTPRLILLAAIMMVRAASADAQSPVGPANSVAGQTQNTGQTTISHCQVFLIDDVPVPAMETGALVSMGVGEGDQVRQGQLLARIDDRRNQFEKLTAELKRNAALAKAQDDIEVRFAQASLGVADAELAQSEEINRRSPGTVSAMELRRLQLTSQRAALQIDRSRLETKIAVMTADVETTAVAAAEDKMERCKIVAPFDGTVLAWIGSGSKGSWTSASSIRKRS